MKIGIDLGGTKTEGILLGSDNAVIETIRQPTPQAMGYDAIIDNTVDLIYKLEAIASRQCTIGIGTPGSVCIETGLMKYCNTVCLNDQPLKLDLERRLDRAIRIENDANCFTLSESLNGSGKNFSIVFGVIMGTGVGGGLVINNKIINGPNGMTGEWGHTTLDPNGAACFCGLSGCIETYLSGPGLIKRYNQASGEQVTRVEQIIQRSVTGEKIALDCLDEYYNYFARAISTIIKIIDPQLIVLGGGMSNIENLYTLAAQRVCQYFAADIDVNIVKNTHGDSSGVRGAANLWA